MRYTNGFRSRKGDSLETTAFGRYGVKTSDNEYILAYCGAIAATFSTVFRRQRLLRVF